MPLLCCQKTPDNRPCTAVSADFLSSSVFSARWRSGCPPVTAAPCATAIAQEGQTSRPVGLRKLNPQCSHVSTSAGNCFSNPRGPPPCGGTVLSELMWLTRCSSRPSRAPSSSSRVSRAAVITCSPPPSLSLISTPNPALSKPSSEQPSSCRTLPQSPTSQRAKPTQSTTAPG